MTGKGLEFSSLVGPTVVLLSMPLDCQDHGFRVVIGRKLRSQGCQQATLSMVLVKDVQFFDVPLDWCTQHFGSQQSQKKVVTS